MVDTLNLNLVPDDSEEEFIVDFGEVINVGGGGTSDFNELTNRPKYDGQTMTGDTDIPKVPTTTSDLENTSDYQTGTEVQTAIDTAIAGKQDTLTVGDNITIENNVISAIDTTYTAGNAITIDENNVIGADIYPADYFTAGGTVTDTGSSFTLDKTIPATLKSVELYGDTEQDGTPTPASPVAVEVVTGTQTINVNGKNLWGGITQYYRNTSGIDFTSYADGTITASGTATANAYSVTSSGALGVGVYINLPAGTYTLSEQNNRGIQVIEAKSGGVILADTGTANVTFTLTEAEDIAVRAYITNGTAITGTITFYPMLEKNSSVTSYVPYQSQTYTVNLGSYEFCKIGDYQDYIYKSGDNWYWHKEIDKIILDGSEDSWNRASIYGGVNFRFYVNVPDIKTTTSETEVGLVISNKLIEITNTAQYAGTQGIRVRSNGSPQLILYIDDTSTMDVDSFKTWLSSNNIICYYALATPTDTILGGTLGRQLDALAEARSYLDVTNFIVTTTGSNLPIILDVEALRNSADGVALREPKIPEVINALDSTDTKNALSANMGRVLNERISNVQETVYDAYDIRNITGDMEPTYPEEEPDGFRIEIFEPQRIYYTDASAPVKIYYSDNDSLNDFVGYIQVDTTEEDVESENPTTTYGFKLTKMNGADNTPEIYVGQSILNLNDNELTSLSFEQVGAGGGGSPYNVYSTVTTSNSNRGGAIYLGNLNASQEQFADPTTSDTHARYIHMLPYSNTTKPASNSIILGSELTSSSATGGIGVGFGASVEASNVINIGGQYGRGQYSVIIGASASNQRPDSQYNVLLGYSSKIDTGPISGAIGIGAYSHPTLSGQIHVGATNTSFGYNNTNYRIISGVHDGIDAHDAATVAQGNTLATSAPTTSTVGVLGQLYTDTTTMHTYQCTDTTGGVYTWTQRW